MIVVDTQKNEKFVTRVRPTLERALLKGKIKSVSDDRSSFVLVQREADKGETFYLDDFRLRREVQAGLKVAIWSHTDPQFRLVDGKERSVVSQIKYESEADKYHETWEDDITVRIATEPVELKDDETVVQVANNGPVKPRLLGDQAKSKAERRHNWWTATRISASTP